MDGYKNQLKKRNDRVRWEFIDVFMCQVCIFISLRRVTMSAISTSTMQIMWNKVPMEKFKPTRDVRQGCHLSPYLFVLCMESLRHSIKKAQSIWEWRPIHLARAGSPLSHLFFAGDLVIFSKADRKHGSLMKIILDQLCKIFGHRINARKTNMFFSRGVVNDVGVKLSGFLGFQKVQDLGTYLGTPLFHKRPTIVSLHFIVKKVMAKLCNWMPLSYP